MNCELWARGTPSFTKPFCGKWGSAEMDPIIPSYLWDSDEGTEQSTEPKNANEEQLFFETRKGNIRSSGKPSTPKAEEGYCNEATQSGPPTHSQRHLAQNTVEHTEVKKKEGHGQKGNKRSGMVLYVMQTVFYRKLQKPST